jgi:hypothetical protein
MSEGTRKKLCGASSNGIGAPRSSDVNTGILDEHVLALVFRSINFDLGWWPPSAALPPPTPHLWATSSAGGLPLPPLPPCRATSPRRPASPRPPGRASCHAGAGVTCCTCRTRASTRWRGTTTTTWRVPRRVPPVHTVPDSGVPGGASRLVGRARVWNLVAAGMVPRSAWRRLGAYKGRLEYYVCISGHHDHASMGGGSEEGHVTFSPTQEGAGAARTVL